MLVVLVLVSLSLVLSALAAVLLYMDDQDDRDGGGAGEKSAGGPTISMGTDLSSLGADGKFPAYVMKEGKKAFEVVLKKGMLHNEGSSSGMRMRPPAFFPAEACRVKFRVWFDDAFDWVQTSSHSVGGKLGGFRIGDGASTGGNYSTGGSSFRLTFSRDRGAVAYLYPALKQNHSNGNPSWGQLDQHASVEDVSHIATGVHVFYPGRQAQLFFKSGRWNDIEMFCKLNTPGKFDGVMELVVNGQRKRLETVRYRYNANMKIERFGLEVFFGGGSQNYAPQSDIRIWYTDFAFGSS